MPVAGGLTHFKQKKFEEHPEMSSMSYSSYIHMKVIKISAPSVKKVMQISNPQCHYR